MAVTLTVGSLFTGIGLLDLGLEWAGMRAVWQCELLRYQSAVLARHWPDVPRRRYVQGIAAAIHAGDLVRPDVIAGGFPCQDASSANPKGAGIGGSRTGLVARMLDVIKAARPRAVVAENVRGLARRGLDDVVSELVALGYDVDVTLISAAAVGAPHQRDRLGIVALRRDQLADPNGGPAQRSRGPGELLRATGEDGCEAREQRHGRAAGDGGACAVADTDGGGCEEQREPMQGRAHDGARRHEPMRRDGAGSAWAHGALEPRVGGGPHGCAARLDAARWPASRGAVPHPWEPGRLTDAGELHRRARLHGLGNAVVPHVGYVLGSRVLQRLGLPYRTTR